MYIFFVEYLPTFFIHLHKIYNILILSSDLLLLWYIDIRVNYRVDLNLFCDCVACMVIERYVDLFTAVLSVSNNSSRDSDSGLGVSADVIVFGKEIENIGRSMSKAL